MTAEVHPGQPPSTTPSPPPSRPRTLTGCDRPGRSSRSSCSPGSRSPPTTPGSGSTPGRGSPASSARSSERMPAPGSSARPAAGCSRTGRSATAGPSASGSGRAREPHVPRPRLRVVPLQPRRGERARHPLASAPPAVAGHRFSLGVADEDGTWHGACIVGVGPSPAPPAAPAPSKRSSASSPTGRTTPARCSTPPQSSRAGHGVRAHPDVRARQRDGHEPRASGWTCEGPAGGGSGSTRTASRGGPTSPRTRRPGGEGAERHAARRRARSRYR